MTSSRFVSVFSFLLLFFQTSVWAATSLLNPGYLSVTPHSKYDEELLKGVRLNGKPIKGTQIESRSYSRILTESLLDPAGEIKIDYIQQQIEAAKADWQTYLASIVCPKAVQLFDRKNKSERLSMESNGICDQAAASYAHGSSIQFSFIQNAFNEAAEGDFVVLGYRFAIQQMTASIRWAQSINAQKLNLRDPAILNGDDMSVRHFLSDFFVGYEAKYAARSPSRENLKHWSLIHLIKSSFRFMTVENKDRVEASDLDYSSLGFGSLRISPEDKRLDGVDQSRLNPAGSLLWQPVDTASYDVRTYNHAFDEMIPAEIRNPQAELSVTFYKPAHGGETPKFEVIGPDKRRYKMKVKVTRPLPNQLNYLPSIVSDIFGATSEIHTQTVANTLAGALGFNIDPYFYHRNVRVYFKNDGFGTPEHEQLFQKAVHSAVKAMMDGDEVSGTDFGYDRLHHNYASLFTKDAEKQDEHGRWYVLIPEASFQARWTAGTYFGIGNFDRSAFNKEFMRDHRGLALLEALMAEADSKSDNSMIYLKNVGSAENHNYQFLYVPEDMGSILGFQLSKELPNLYYWNIIDQRRSVRGQKLVLNYFSIYHDPIYNSVNIDDAKWFTRILAQLTRAQIEGIFEAAGYPSPVKEYLAEKLMFRRDQLVEWTGVDLPPGVPAKISTVTDPSTYAVPGYEKYFKKGLLISNIKDLGLDERYAAKLLPGKSPQKSYDKTVQEGAFASLLSLGQHYLNQYVERIQLFGGVYTLGKQIKGEIGAYQIMPLLSFVENDGDREHPWLRVEDYRFGISHRLVSNQNSGFADDLIGNAPGVQGDIAYVWELVKVTPVTSKDVSNLSNLGFSFKLSNFLRVDEAMKGITSGLLKEQRVGDALISRRYKILSGSARSINNMGAFSVGPLGEVGAAFETIAETSLLKVSDDQVVANWANTHQTITRGNASILALIFKWPFAGFQTDKTNRKIDETFVINPQNGLQLEDLIENLHRTKPEFRHSSPKKTLTRHLDSSLKRVFLSLLSLRTISGGKADYHIDQTDEVTGQSSRLDEVISGSKSTAFWEPGVRSHNNESIRAKELDLGNNPQDSLSYEFDYKKVYASLDDYKRLYDHILVLMPATFKALTPDSGHVTLPIGTLSFTGKLTFGSSALNEIFKADHTSEDACERYYQHLPLVIQKTSGSVWAPNEWCALANRFDNGGQVRIQPADRAEQIEELLSWTHSFANDFGNVEKHVDKPNIKNYLKALRNIGHAHSSQDRLMRILTLESFVSQGKIIRQGHLDSSADAFIGRSTGVNLEREDQFGNLAQDNDLRLAKTSLDVLRDRISSTMLNPTRLARITQQRPACMVDLQP